MRKPTQKQLPPNCKIIPEYHNANVYRLWDENENFPVDTSVEAQDAVAAFIGQSVRSYDALVKAMRDIADDAGEFMHGDSNAQTAVRALAKKAKAALALAGVE